MEAEDASMDSESEIPDWFKRWYKKPRSEIAQTQLDAWHDRIRQLHELVLSFRMYSVQEVLAILYEGSEWVTEYSVDPKHGSLEPEYTLTPITKTLSYRQFLPYLIRIVDPVHKTSFEEFAKPLVDFLGFQGEKLTKLKEYKRQSDTPRFDVHTYAPSMPNSDFNLVTDATGTLKTSRGAYTPNAISQRTRDVKAYFKTLQPSTGGRGWSDSQQNNQVLQHWSDGLDPDQTARVHNHFQRLAQEATLARGPLKQTARDTQARRTLCQLLGAAVPAAGTDTEASPLYVAMLGILEAIRIKTEKTISRPLRLTRSEKQAVASLLVQACESPSGADQLHNTALQRATLQLSRPPYSPRVLEELQAAGLLV
jgi:hypothetical protein